MTPDSRVRQLLKPNGVLELRWARPEAANAFDQHLLEELLDALHRAQEERPRVLVLAGDGGRFSAGFDLGGELNDQMLAWRFGLAEAALATVREFPAVTVACVVGPAFGLGADLVTSCDYRLGDERCRFRFPGSRFGVILGTDQLRIRVGASRATDILLRNTIVDAESAVHDGLLTNLLPVSEQDEFVGELAEDLDGLDDATLRNLLAVLRLDDPDASLANLSRSTHHTGLGERVEQYRAQTPVGTATRPGP